MAPPCAAVPAAMRNLKIFFFCFLIMKFRNSDAIRHIHVLKDPGLGSDTTVCDNGGSGSRFLGRSGSLKFCTGNRPIHQNQYNKPYIGCLSSVTLLASRSLAPTRITGKLALVGSRTSQNPLPMLNTLSSDSVRESRIQYLCDPQWFRDTASRGPTTIAAPKSQFRTCLTDHGKAPSNITPWSPRVSMTFRVMRTNQYNQDLGLIHSTNGNDLESPNEGSSIDHEVTIYLHAQNITMFPTNETWYFASQILVSSSGGLILILMAQSTRN
ncbi:hypothetical protein F511_38283 [Dorcoceras hygrometricum]|uniref:Uncharacterized protein n=1 Tax=Dorcoceras hygrometricum TaxID=472368 RepID=A0A2Z7BGL0_9LAMI|nr:hypothetical protein F511_38283 [Dorcoceras hygrometricum]